MLIFGLNTNWAELFGLSDSLILIVDVVILGLFLSMIFGFFFFFGYLNLFYDSNIFDGQTCLKNTLFLFNVFGSNMTLMMFI